MDIKPSSLTSLQGLLPVNSDPVELAKLFSPGRILYGVIEQVAHKANANRSGSLFEVLINAEGKKIVAESNQQFTAGQTVKLEVMKDAALRVLQIVVPSTEKQQSLVQQGLRQTLPLQQNHHLLLNRLPPLEQLINNLNRQVSDKGLHHSQNSQQLPQFQHLQQVRRQISELLTNLPRGEQLRHPAQLKQAITNNGSFFEAKLQRVAQQLTAPPDNTQQPRPNNEQPIREILRRNAPLIKQFEGLVSKDLKAQLIKLAISLAPLSAKPAAVSTTAGATAPAAEAQLITRILQAAATPAANRGDADPGRSIFSRPAIDISQLLINPQTQQLLSQIGAQPTNNQNTPPRETFDLAISTLLRQIASSIAKIQSNQLTAIAGQQAAADTNTVNSWYVEIPVFSEGQFRPIQLQIEEQRSPDQPKEAKQGRQWKITLGFDFEELGEFFATLTLVENTLSTTFWSERPQTLKQIRSELDILKKSLKSKGLEVTQLECRSGRPPMQSTRLDQQLVDIKT